jgi:hypothetical protein
MSKVWDKLYDLGCSKPVPLDSVSGALSSFVYDRKYGVFKCDFGAHPTVMSQLMAIHLGYDNGIDLAIALKIDFSYGTSQLFLQQNGTAYCSSVSDMVEAWDARNLKEWEVKYFGGVRYIGDGVLRKARRV